MNFFMHDEEPVSHAIIIRLLGGLGNQMFQYALGRAVSIKWKVPLLLDRWLLEDHRPGQHLTLRRYDLDIFTISPRFATKRDVRRYHSFGQNNVVKVYFHVRRKLSQFGLAAKAPVSIEDIGFHFDPTVFDHEPPLHLAGLWQSHRYFNEIAEILRADFNFRHKLEGKGREMAELIADPNAVVLHVRRGDYISDARNAALLGFPKLDYYARAIARVRESTQNPSFFVFSDDLDWARENLPLGTHNAHFVDLSAPQGVRQYGFELQLMTHGSNFIIANSTFSWWAAWLAGERARLVLTPARWFADSTINTDDMSPQNWERL